MNNIKYKPYKSGDEYKHIDLMWNSSPHVRNIQYWNWKNNKFWGGRPIIQYAFDRDLIIGSYVVHPISLFFENNNIKAGFGTQLLIHDKYRSLEILKGLNDGLMELCDSSGIEFIYGFPNNSIWNINLKFFQWNDIGKINYYECDLDNIRINRSKYNVDIINKESINKLSPSINQNNANIDSIVRFKRDNNWFNWRYFDNPLNHYKVFYVNAGKMGTGIIVAKYFHENPLVIGHIVDIIISDNNHDIFDSLLSKMILDFRFIGVSKVSFWRTCNDWVKSSLLDKGFKEKEKYSNFGVKNLSYGDIEKVSNSDIWDVSMCNSDAF